MTTDTVTHIQTHLLDFRTSILRADRAPHPAHDFKVGDIVTHINDLLVGQTILLKELVISLYLHGTAQIDVFHALLNKGMQHPLGENKTTQQQLDEIYGSFYKDDELVTVLFGGAQPKTGSVAGTTRAHVAVVLNEHANVIVATCAIDNVGKGAAGQAIQCANIVFGLPETCGLQTIAIPA